MQGWIKLHRRLSDNELWKSEPFTDGQAWVDLIMLANHTKGVIKVRGIRVIVCRGQVGWSERSLAERWQWSRGKVRRYIEFLAGQDMIKIVPQKKNVIHLLSIINYDEYQEGSTTNSTTNEPQTNHKRTTNVPEQE